MKVGDLVTCQPKGDTYYLRDPADNMLGEHLRIERGESAIVMQIKPYISGWEHTAKVLVLTSDMKLGWIEEKYIVCC
jgi:hypothetical protein